MAFENLNTSVLGEAARAEANAIINKANIEAQTRALDRERRLKAIGAVGGFLFGGPAAAAVEGTGFGSWLHDTTIGNLMGVKLSEEQKKKKQQEEAEKLAGGLV